ncbi:MAG TPA: NAD(P)-dependent alcohol dehydrogenase [Chloroflexota bacterium]|nr:NAD(P)-dependent alcohol dehydrogenase [Chloroflexota bacterium]
MAMKVDAVVLQSIGQLAIERRECAEPGPDEVLVAPRVVGICGSDMHLYKEGRIGDSILERPLVLGHEAAGRVVAVGSNVEGLAAGDRVIVEPGLACGQCRWCRVGRYNLCPHVRFLGIPHTDGLLAGMVRVPARWVYRLPDSIGDAEGAMIEPFAVGLQAVHEADVQPGQTVVILGAGPIGLMILQAARVRGAGTIVSIDLAERPLDMARRLGATVALDPRQSDVLATVRDLTDGDGADVVIEAVGATPTIRQAFDLVRRGGTITLVGIAAEPTIPLGTNRIVRSGLQVRSSFRYAHQHPVAIALAAAGRVDLRSLITHRFELGRAPEAFRYVEQHKADVIKGVIDLAASV